MIPSSEKALKIKTEIVELQLVPSIKEGYDQLTSCHKVKEPFFYLICDKSLCRVVQGFAIRWYRKSQHSRLIRTHYSKLSFEKPLDTQVSDPTSARTS